ncbi:MAG: hypothetical protein E6I26_13375 [Chloroflexi bacterium]|nr:MAG: hypothetical protein E6I26_13375 [Chloroflexota bacterium]
MLPRAPGVPHAIRRDPADVVRRVLARVAVVADLPTAVALQPDLPPGWSLVTRDGQAVVGELAVRGRLPRREPIAARAEISRSRVPRRDRRFIRGKRGRPVRARRRPGTDGLHRRQSVAGALDVRLEPG